MMPNDPAYPGSHDGARIIVETDDGQPWAGTVTDVIRGGDGQAKSYAWRPDAADIPGHPWYDTPDAVVVTAAADVTFVAGSEVLSDPHGNAATAAGRIELDLSPGPPQWEDQPVVDAVTVRRVGGIAHVHDIAHGAIDVPAGSFTAALRLDRSQLIDRIRQAPTHPVLAGDEPAVTLAALAALHGPTSPDTPSLPGPPPLERPATELPLPPTL